MDCLFCAIVAGDIPSTRVYEDELTYAFMDISPASEGHLIVVPKRHSRDILEIDAEDLTAVALTGQRLARRVTEVLGADGVNLLNNRGEHAWQTVFHFHLHVIPRYADKSRDRLQLPWVPEPGDPDAIRAMGARLTLG
ncbi:HIT family protein [Nocardioides sp. BP30]|uniref:HIT family protein n=1 Tax=Nocardioides sp. BP30 TaxID=3036374 RepID=UPI002468A168|nr:HIT family protein [Nocardioides sp. BP30]WGL52691.1 HIT family protein [Nocardioides sp. BP30]